MKEGEICRDNGGTESGITNMMNQSIETNGLLLIHDRREGPTMKMSIQNVDTLIQDDPLNGNTESLPKDQAAKEVVILRIIRQIAPHDRLVPDLRHPMAHIIASECHLQEDRGQHDQWLRNRERNHYRRQRNPRIARSFYSCITCSFIP